MTEQETNAFANRLKRIWGPVQYQLPVPQQDERVFDAVLKPDVRVEVRGKAKLGQQQFCLRFFTTGLRWVSQVAELRASHVGEITWSLVYDEDKELATQLVQQWLPFFRRGCWLSGCPIEATAHEKADWIRDFTREEIEAWNLKF